MVKERTTPANKNGRTTNNLLFNCLLILFVGLIAYSNSLHVPFVFDDVPNIVGNPAIKDLITFVSSPANFFNNRFVGYLSFALNYALHSRLVTGYHVVNLAVHIINALLLYRLILLTFQTPFLITTNSECRTHLIALFSSLLFVSHPIQTQAVTYIVQRFTSLATLFYLLSLVTYIKFRMKNTEVNIQAEEKQGKPLRLKAGLWYPASIIFAVLAMRTKEIAFTLPVIIALYEFLFFEGKIRKRILYLIPLLLTMLIIPLTLLGTDKPLGELISDVSEKTRVQTAVSRWDYLFTQFRVIVTYLRLLMFPANQNLDYDYPVYHSFFDPPVLLSFLFLFFLLAVALSLAYRTFHSSFALHNAPCTVRHIRFISFGILWFFIALSVESSIVPIADVIFEQRVYLPSAGAFVAITTSLVSIVSRLRNRWPWLEKAMIPALACGVIILSGATYVRNIVWQDELSLWENAVKNSPRKARAHNNLGVAYNEKALQSYSNKSMLDDAIMHLTIATQLDPSYAAAHSNLGAAYADKGMTGKAIEHDEIAITLDPSNYKSHFNLGTVYIRSGLRDKGIDEIKISLQINPNFSEALVYLDKVKSVDR